MLERKNEIILDIDRDRIKEIVSESLRIIVEYSGGELLLTEESIQQKLDTILDSNTISTEFRLSIPLDKIPDLMLHIDPRKRKVLCKSCFRKKVARINTFIRVL